MDRVEGADCARCGATIPAGAPFGQCPRCLLGLASLGRGSAPGASVDEAGPCGRSFGDYELIEEIARGGMGVVYRAWQKSLQREVAVKTMLAGELATVESVRRFRNEAEVAARLDHPHIVSVYDFGERDHQHFLSMRLVPGGRNIAMWARLLDLPPIERARAIAAMMVKVARAVAYAHERGVLHRDLKPSNILMDGEGEPVVTDFGLAKLVDRESDLTHSAAMLGSPGYMAPEQAGARHGEVTTATDVYGLGAVLYELLSGQPPFSGRTPLDTARMVVEEAAPAVDTVAPELATICLKCIEKEPSRRYASAAAVADDLERWLRGEPIEAQAATTWERVGKWARRKPVHAALAATVALALGALIVGLFWHNHRIQGAQRATEAANHQLTEQVRRLEWQNAEEALAAGHTPDALTTFARFLRETPDDLTAGSRLSSLLESRAFPLPLLPPLKHDRPVARVRFDHEGRNALTLTDDGVLRSWDLSNGDLQNRAGLDLVGETFELLEGHPWLLVRTKAGRVLTWNYGSWRIERELGVSLPYEARPSLSEDGRLLSMVSPDRELQLWDTAGGKLLAHASLPSGARIEFPPSVGPQGETLFSEGERTFWLWEPEKDSLKPFWEPRPQLGCFLCDWANRRVFICATEPANRFQVFSFSLDTGRELARQPLGAAWHVMRISPDARRLFIAGWGGGAVIKDADTLTDLSPVFARAPVLANLSADGAFTVGFRAAHDGSGVLFDLRDSHPLQEPVQQRGVILGHDLNPAGDRLLTASQDGVVSLWDVRMRTAGQPLIAAGSEVQRLALSPDGEQLVAGCYQQLLSCAAPTGENRVTWATTERDHFNDVQFSSDGRLLCAACTDGSVRMIEAGTGRTLWINRDHERRAFRAVFSPDDRVVASAGEDGTVRVFDTGTGEARFPPLRHVDSVGWVSFSPDGRWLASAGLDPAARLWDAATGEPVGPSLRHQAGLSEARFSPDSRRLVTSSGDRTVQVWEVPSGAPVAPPVAAGQGLLGASFSADGRRVLIHTLEAAQVFDAETSEPLTPPMRHADRVTVAAFSPDDRWVATASADGTARIWDSRTGFPLTEPFDHGAAVNCLLWLPDSRGVLAGGMDWNVWRHEVSHGGATPAWLPDLAEALAGRRDEGGGRTAPVASDRLDALRQLAEGGGDATFHDHWLKWFLVERLQSPVPPPLP